MQVTINLEQELLEAARQKAQSHQVSLDYTMSQLLRLGLAADAGQRFSFSVPGGTVTARDVNAALEDDDE